MDKKNICVIFGGQSSEHMVSLASASFVMSNVDSTKYNMIPVGITQDGRWFLYSGPIDRIRSNTWQDEQLCKSAFIAPDAGIHGLIVLNGNREDGKIDNNTKDGQRVEEIRLDCIIPVLHGRFGEDGTIQGLFEMAQIPYVGCGVTASANAMDKVFSRTIFDAQGIPQANWTWCTKSAFVCDSQAVIARIERDFSYPIFIKPANAGSSVGVSKAKTSAEFANALKLAFEHDCKAVIEEFIDCREIEAAVLGGDPPIVSVCGEVIPAKEFYDYEAKYHNENSRLFIPAPISDEECKTIRLYALQTFAALDCAGLSRIDFFIRKQDGKIFLNEINTMPGFTEISMYPKLMSYSGIEPTELVSRLIDLAMSQN